MNTYLKYSLICCFVLVTVVLQAQNQPTLKLFLKDGSALLGHLVEENDQNLTFQFSNGEKIIFSQEEIKDYAEIEEDVQFFPGGKWLKENGAYAIFSSNLMLGDSYKYYVEGPAMSVSPFGAVFGYAFDRYKQVGFGTSIDILLNEDRIFLPLFLEYRISPFKGAAEPFLAVGAGYGIGLTGPGDEDWDISNYDGGFHFRTTAGLTFASVGDAKFQIGIHYQLQESTEDLNFCNIGFGDCNNDQRYITYKRFGLNLGVRF